jgi:DNA-directed RNA polymerase subunit RPC12/RpoP
MDEAQKKPIMIGIIVVCVVIAVAVTIKTWSGDSGGIPDEMKKEQIWVKCRVPDCLTTYEMNKYDYYKSIDDYLAEHPQAQIAPGLTCQKCEKPAVYAAHKCEKCGNIFEKGLKKGDFEDRCPKCKHSTIEEDRKRNAGAT